ncbi:AbrB/MazE/SpoVT family DNA-binding domain-containing protein [Candidatus Daviesbacteria bacterium]|nr:AbrB/MazE/SpoVT family DNA-binding domain-containing protein [Candidatus Daviesbacteria bacterium]
MKITLLSSKGQITIPKDIQQELKLAPRMRIALYPQKGALLVKPLKTSIVDQVGGSLLKYIPPSKRGIPFSKVMEETKKIVARDLVKKMNKK